MKTFIIPLCTLSQSMNSDATAEQSETLLSVDSKSKLTSVYSPPSLKEIAEDGIWSGIKIVFLHPTFLNYRL